MPADYRAQVRDAAEAIARDSTNDLIVRNAARCVRGYFKPPMVEPLDASTNRDGEARAAGVRRSVDRGLPST
jgi:hypothetical protein